MKQSSYISPAIWSILVCLLVWLHCNQLVSPTETTKQDPIADAGPNASFPLQ
jgi:hypothetical protein